MNLYKTEAGYMWLYMFGGDPCNQNLVESHFTFNKPHKIYNIFVSGFGLARFP
jgi:hypothetical protein